MVLLKIIKKCYFPNVISTYYLKKNYFSPDSYPVAISLILGGRRLDTGVNGEGHEVSLLVTGSPFPCHPILQGAGVV